LAWGNIPSDYARKEQGRRETKQPEHLYSDNSQDVLVTRGVVIAIKTKVEGAQSEREGAQK